jgi:hypothetical protein
MSAGLRGIDANDIDVSLSGDMLVLNAKNARKRTKRTRIITF